MGDISPELFEKCNEIALKITEIEKSHKTSGNEFLNLVDAIYIGIKNNIIELPNDYLID